MVSTLLAAMLGFAIGTTVSLSLGVVAPLVGVLFSLVFVRLRQAAREHGQPSARARKRMVRRTISNGTEIDDDLMECPFQNREPIFERWDMERNFTK